MDQLAESPEQQGKPLVGELAGVPQRSHDPVGIFLAGCRECLADWEAHAGAQSRGNPIARRATAQGATAALPTWANTSGETSACLPTWANRVGNSADDPA